MALALLANPSEWAQKYIQNAFIRSPYNNNNHFRSSLGIAFDEIEGISPLLFIICIIIIDPFVDGTSCCLCCCCYCIEISYEIKLFLVVCRTFRVIKTMLLTMGLGNISNQHTSHAAHIHWMLENSEWEIQNREVNWILYSNELWKVSEMKS